MPIKVDNWTLEGWWLWESHAAGIAERSHPALHSNYACKKWMQGRKGSMTAGINGIEADSTAGWYQYVGVCWREHKTPSEAAVRLREGKLLSTDTRWEEVLSAVAELYLGRQRAVSILPHTLIWSHFSHIQCKLFNSVLITVKHYILPNINLAILLFSS